jgi:hypothetical protein
LPAVRGPTRFIIAWFDKTNHLGNTEITVFPTNILAELKPLSGGDDNLGLYDPANVLKPLLGAQSVSFVDLEQAGVADFDGRLAIIGPFETAEQCPRDMPDRIKTLAGKGAAIVWIQPPRATRRLAEPLRPSFERLAVGTGSVVLAQPQILDELKSSPKAQHTLVSLCKIAVNREPLTFPAAPPENP